MTPAPIISVTTDFGLQDGYVAAMKGVIAGIAPETRVVDVSHQVPPQNVTSAAYVLATVVPYFPPGTIHLAVVDPGVGTERRPIAVEWEGARFVGPDNGLFPICFDLLRGPRRESTTPLAVELINPAFRRTPVSATFHGRDIFAPAAASLAVGVPILELGRRVTDLVELVGVFPDRRDDELLGTIMHIDRFGNAISNISGEMVPAHPVFRVGGATISGLSRTYADAPVLALVGSSGRVEIAIRNGNASRELGIEAGDPLIVRSGA